MLLHQHSGKQFEVAVQGVDYYYYTELLFSSLHVKLNFIYFFFYYERHVREPNPLSKKYCVPLLTLAKNYNFFLFEKDYSLWK